MNITIDSNIQHIIMRLGGVNYPISTLKFSQNGSTPETIWSGGSPAPIDYSQDYFTIESLEDGNTITFNKSSGPDITYYWSTDGGSTWTSYNATASQTLNTGDKLLMKCTCNTFSAGTYYYWGFSSTKTFNVSGNIMSLLYGDDFIGQTTLPNYNYVFNKIFYNCSKLISAENLVLPATTLATHCYREMFRGCTSLTTVPSIFPATTLTQYCYMSMFMGCSSLITAPTLPASTLAQACYASMFYSCTSLTNVPELSATTLVNECYHSMFYGCTSLTTAPELPATTLANDCYRSMFQNCTSLTVAPELSATTLKSECYQYMFQGCISLTTAPILPATTLATYCYFSMFQGCTSLTTAPALPATTLANYCYQNMFRGCTSLTTTPVLPASTLKNYCYNSMFNGCTSLTTITCLATNISASNCLTNWVTSVASAGTFYKNPSMTSWPTGTSGIPSGWTTVDYAA